MDFAGRTGETLIQWAQHLLDLVYPRTCTGCGAQVAAAGSHMCWDCLTALDLIRDPFCSHCGDPVDGMVEHAFVCSACRRFQPAFDGARSVVRYRGNVRNALQSLKYRRATCVGSDLTPLLCACVSTHYARVPFDAVTCVPLHARRERERTYNQSRILARNLARRLRLPLFAECLRRRRPTTTQTDLTARARRENVRDAFAAVDPRWIEGRVLLLVDDVMTTGATVGECSRVLKQAGAAGVYVVTVARG